MVLPPGGAASLFSAACTAAAAACALYVAWRDSAWRKHGMAQQLSKRVDAAQKAADHWHETAEAVRIREELISHRRAIAEHDARVGALATKADIHDVKVAASALKAEVKSAAMGIDRIEGLLIRRALERDK